MKGNIIGRGRTALIYAWGDGQVLKLYEKGIPATRVEAEAEQGRLIHAAAIPSPDVEGYIEEDGRPGIIFERLSGPTMLQYITAKPWLIIGTARRFAELQADMHSREIPQLPSLSEKIKARLAIISLLSLETKAQLITLLENYPGTNAVCHGDFHPDNLILSAQGPVIIDWLDATTGNPLYDVARTSYLLSKAALPPGTGLFRRLIIQLFRKTFHRFYLRRYRQLRPFTGQELKDWYRVVAAARLTEGIAEEEAQLLAIVYS